MITRSSVRPICPWVASDLGSVGLDPELASVAALRTRFPTAAVRAARGPGTAAVNER